jgi:predicted acetyltransferase
MDFEVRPIGSEQLDDVLKLDAAAFGEEEDREHRDTHRAIFQGARSIAAFDGDLMIGVASIYPFELTVPGGLVPAAGITSVAVLPTHRRRGVNTALMRRQMEDLHEGGEPVAYLWASEGAIYQRFGYGTGALSGSFSIDRRNTAFLRPVEHSEAIRLVDKDAALKTFPSVYERLRPSVPGMVTQDETWWNHLLLDTTHARRDDGALFLAVFESPEGAEGYVAYRIDDTWDNAGPKQTLSLELLLATTREAYAALWRYCLDLDLVRKVTGWKRPVDEPLLHLLVEPRALRFTIRDGTWLRLVDVAPALEARRYPVEDRLVLGLRDGFCEWNEGRYELEGGPDGASCMRTDAEPDLELEVTDLAAMYLGAVGASTLVRAGRVMERNAGAAKRADAMFASDPAPWCPHIF